MMTNEKIAAAAIRIGNEVFTGTTHFAAMRKIIAMPGVDPATISGMILKGEDGFVTDSGRFEDRAEAFEIARAQKQISHTELADPEKNMAFYNTDKPSLDSGIVESYARMRACPSYVY